jgi:thymidylate synthase
MNAIEHQYLSVLHEIVNHGTDKSDRTGTGTKSIFGYQIIHDMKQGFPLLTTKKMPFKVIVTELLWFLRGDTNIKYLVDNNCHIWDGDAYKRYHTAMNSDEWIENWVEPGEKQDEARKNKGSNGYTKEEFIHEIKTDAEFAKMWGELGPIYGKQWRNWDVPKILTIEKGKIENGIGTEWGSWERNPIDQIANLISELKTNPDSRRLMVNVWNVGELSEMVLPPCHYGFQVYTRKTTREEKITNPGKYRAISLMWNQRSVDTFLGLPFNIASYALLLEIIAKAVNMVPDELIGNLGDVHLYNNHIEQAKEQLNRKPFELPTLQLNPIFLANLEHKGLDEALNGQINFQLENYQSHPAIKAPLSN